MTPNTTPEGWEEIIKKIIYPDGADWYWSITEDTMTYQPTNGISPTGLLHSRIREALELAEQRGREEAVRDMYEAVGSTHWKVLSDWGMVAADAISQANLNSDINGFISKFAEENGITL